MEAFEAIYHRRSVRNYLDKSVAKNLVEEIVKAGLQAPSGRNVQPIEYIAVTDPIKRKKLAAICDYGKFLAEAPVCLVVISRNTKYYLEDGSAATENTLIAATALGLATCWIAGDKKPYVSEILRLLEVPTNYKLVCLIAVGYAAVTPAGVDKTILARGLHWESFQGVE